MAKIQYEYIYGHDMRYQWTGLAVVIGAVISFIVGFIAGGYCGSV